MRRALLAILFAGALLAAGCRHGGQPQPQEPDTTADTVAAAQPPASQCLPLIYNTVGARVACEVQNWQLGGQIRISRDSAIWISINKLIELGRVLVTTDSVKVYIKVNNSQLTASFNDIKNLFGLDIDYYTLQSIIVGDMPSALTKSGDALMVVTEEDNSLRRIRSADIRGQQASGHLHVDYSNFEPLGDMPFATTLKGLVESRPGRWRFTLHYDKIELDTPVSMPFAIPRSAKKLIPDNS